MGGCVCFVIDSSVRDDSNNRLWKSRLRKSSIGSCVRRNVGYGDGNSRPTGGADVVETGFGGRHLVYRSAPGPVLGRRRSCAGIWTIDGSDRARSEITSDIENCLIRQRTEGRV